MATITGDESVGEGDAWAVNLYVRCATSWPATLDTPGSFEGNWYTHFLDREDHHLTQQVRAHVIPTGPGIDDPAPIQHPRHSRIIYPWIDFFAYWQAYELAEILNAAVLFQPIRPKPYGGSCLRGSLSRADHSYEHVRANDFL